MPWLRPFHRADLRDDLQAALLEFIGTTFFLTLAFGGTQASGAAASGAGADNVAHIMFIAQSFGLSLLISAWLFFRVTGGLFNPNVSLALLLTGLITPVRCALYCIAQMLGGIAAAALVEGLTPSPLASNTFLAEGINAAQGVFIEAFITGALVLAVLMLGAEKHYATPFAPVGVGLTMYACHLFAVYYTGAAMNTARSFGPAVVTGFPNHQHWVYWLGPFIGSLVGAFFYSTLRLYRYWTLNPGQDSQNPEHSPETALERKMTSRSRARTSTSEETMARNSGLQNGRANTMV